MPVLTHLHITFQITSLWPSLLMQRQTWATVVKQFWIKILLWFMRCHLLGIEIELWFLLLNLLKEEGFEVWFLVKFGVMVFELYRDLLELKRLIILADAIIRAKVILGLLFMTFLHNCFQRMSLVISTDHLLARLGMIARPCKALRARYCAWFAFSYSLNRFIWPSLQT